MLAALAGDDNYGRYQIVRHLGQGHGHRLPGLGVQTDIRPDVALKVGTGTKSELTPKKPLPLKTTFSLRRRR